MSDAPLTEAEMEIARDVIGGLGSDMSRIDTDDVEDAARAIRAYAEKTTNERLKHWETAFETTNPAQAIAEHWAVLAKRKALQDENAVLRQANDSITAINHSAKKLADQDAGEIAHLKAELDEARKAPERSEEQ